VRILRYLDSLDVLARIPQFPTIRVRQIDNTNSLFVAVEQYLGSIRSRELLTGYRDDWLSRRPSRYQLRLTLRPTSREPGLRAADLAITAAELESSRPCLAE
jgi:hypothetical protein